MKLYDSIQTMPINIWFKIHETSDLKHLIIDGEPKDNELNEAWDKAYSEYIKEFGVSDNFKDYLEVKRLLIYQQIDYTLDPSPINDTRLKMAQIEHDTYFDKVEGQKISVTFAQIDKYLGVQTDKNKMTVMEYYGYLKARNEELISKAHGRESD